MPNPGASVTACTVYFLKLLTKIPFTDLKYLYFFRKHIFTFCVSLIELTLLSLGVEQYCPLTLKKTLKQKLLKSVS